MVVPNGAPAVSVLGATGGAGGGDGFLLAEACAAHSASISFIDGSPVLRLLHATVAKVSIHNLF